MKLASAAFSKPLQWESVNNELSFLNKSDFRGIEILALHKAPKACGDFGSAFAVEPLKRAGIYIPVTE